MNDSLSPREIEVLVLIAQGCRNAEIAKDLAISIETVKRHVARIKDKLCIRQRVCLANYAVKEGLV